MFKKAAPFQGTIAVMSASSALLLGYLAKNPRWYHIGLITGAIIPYTISFCFFSPLNKKERKKQEKNKRAKGEEGEEKIGNLLTFFFIAYRLIA